LLPPKEIPFPSGFGADFFFLDLRVQFCCMLFSPQSASLRWGPTLWAAVVPPYGFSFFPFTKPIPGGDVLPRICLLFGRMSFYDGTTAFSPSGVFPLPLHLPFVFSLWLVCLFPTGISLKKNGLSKLPFFGHPSLYRFPFDSP